MFAAASAHDATVALLNLRAPRSAWPPIALCAGPLSRSGSTVPTPSERQISEVAINRLRRRDAGRHCCSPRTPSRPALADPSGRVLKILRRRSPRTAPRSSFRRDDRGRYVGTAARRPGHAPAWQPVDRHHGVSDTRQTTWRVLRSKVKLLDRVMMTINGAPQLNGRIETFATRISREGATMEDRRTDLAAPALSWDADHRAPEGLATHSGVGGSLRPAGIPVLIGADVDQARIVQMGTTCGSRESPRSSRTGRPSVTAQPPQPGEKVWQLADEIARRPGTSSDRPAEQRACLSWWTARVLQRLASPSPGASPTARRRQHPRQRRGVQRPRGAYGDQRLFGDRHGAGGLEPRRASPPRTSGSSTRREPRLRCWTLRRHQPATSAQAGRTVAEGGSRGLRSNGGRAVAGPRLYKLHGRATGRTTDTGHLLHAIQHDGPRARRRGTDANGNPLDESMLITRVEFMRSRQTGTTTTVTLSPRDAISVVPQDVRWTPPNSARCSSST